MKTFYNTHKHWMKPLLFALIGAFGGLAYYFLIGCSSGSCVITASPITSALYGAMIGFLLSGAACPCCGGGSCDINQGK